MSPRLESISSSSVSVTDCGAKASVSSPSNVTMLFTRLFFRDGRLITSSPCRMMPEAIVPEKPRKSRFGRSTSCTGKRKSSRLRSEPMYTVSSSGSSGEPVYQGMFGLGATTLSPLRAEIGMKWTSGSSRRPAKST